MASKAPAVTDSKEFERLVMPHLDAMLRTGARLTRSTTEAEDLVQEALLKALRFFSSFARDTNFKAWIFKILMNTFFNEWRRRRPEPGIDHDTAPEIAAPEKSTDTANLGTTFLRREAGVLEVVDDRIRQAILELPEPLRLVFMLSTLEDLKYREIADVLGVPLGTVMSRLFRSRAMLQERLEQFASDTGYSRH